MIKLALIVLGFAGTAMGQDVARAAPSHPLVWDRVSQTFSASPADESHIFEFKVKNTGPNEVVVVEIVPSCGCTVAAMLESPWKIKPGATGSTRVSINFAGRQGALTKTLEVRSSAGPQTLTIQVTIPASHPANLPASLPSNRLPTAKGEPARPSLDNARKELNQSIAKTNPQAVFVGQCAACHAKPAGAQMGESLYQAICAICHDSPNRASMVPDLGAARRLHTDELFWRTRIADGLPGTLMPKFAYRNGGPLSDDQIESLVKFLIETDASSSSKN